MIEEEVGKDEEWAWWRRGAKASLPTAGGTDAKATRTAGVSLGHPVPWAEGPAWVKVSRLEMLGGWRWLRSGGSQVT